MSDLPHILLVEDNRDDVELTLTALAESNLVNRVDVVRDGVEALEYLCGKGPSAAAGIPAVVLLDIKMPRMDGIEVLRHIRSDRRLKTLPVVMLTSSSMESDIIESYGLGANAYVVKPVGFSEFVAAVKNIGIFWALLNRRMEPEWPK
ncbi:MAG: response regulator [Acidobacteriota bacterium]|jgi:CheY-like chemotaxis protein|nr:response regulator [Acidobacteriota bacterium]